MVCSSPGLRVSLWPPALAKHRVGSAALWETRLPQPILSLPGRRGFRNAPPTRTEVPALVIRRVCLDEGPSRR